MVPEKMKAAVMTGVNEMDTYVYDVPEVASNEVLIQMKSAAICTADQRVYKGTTKEPLPRVAGHEGAGVIVAVGDCVESFKIGDHVAIGSKRCGVCQNCILGVGRCLNSKRLWSPDDTYTLEAPQNIEGCFAQYVKRTELGIYKVDKKVPFKHAALVEPLSDVVRSVRRSRLSIGETCVVIGAGIMGLLHTQIAKNVGARVIISEIDATRREMAKKAGADVVINPQGVDPVQTVMDLTDGRGADVVFFAIAISTLFEQSYNMLAGAGRIIAYSSQHPDDPVPIKIGQLHRSQKEIIGTIGFGAEDALIALQMMAYEKVDMDMVIAKTFPITQCKDAYDASIVPGTYRVVILMDEE